MTDSRQIVEPIVFTIAKDEIRPSCGECGCPPTAIVVDGEIADYRCGHCHEAAPLECTETPENHWPGEKPEFDGSISDILEENL